MTKKTQDLIDVPFSYNGQLVPGIWRYFFNEEIQGFRLPTEKKSDCYDCPKAAYEGYNKTYKCCSYHPVVPNFLLGMSLSQPTSKKIVKKLLKQNYLTPEGLMRTPQMWIDYLADLSEDNFGGANRVKCPILSTETGLCQIYAHRNGVCSTFFCYNDHGKKGEDFWKSLEELVTHFESVLTQWTLEEIGFPLKKYFRKLDKLNVKKAHDPDSHTWRSHVLDDLWGDWRGKELELFKACGDLIRENRHRLWEIVDDRAVMEASRYEKEIIKAVPKKYEDEIDPEDLNDDDNNDDVVLEDHYEDLKKHYRKLHRIPDTLELNEKVLLQKNPLENNECQHYSKKPFMVEFLERKNAKTYDWREFVEGSHLKALKLFQSKKDITPQLEKKIASLGINDPLDFLSKWHGKKVLVRPKSGYIDTL